MKSKVFTVIVTLNLLRYFINTCVIAPRENQTMSLLTNAAIVIDNHSI